MSENRHVWCACNFDLDIHCHCTLPSAMPHTMGIDRANALERLAVVLRSLEWSGEYGICPMCDQVRAIYGVPKGHSPDCPVGGALAAMDSVDAS